MNRRASHTLGGLLGIVALLGVLAACGGGEAQVELKSLPPAEVTVDGSSVGTTPIQLTLPAGKREIAFSREGFETVNQTLEVKAGVPGELSVSLSVSDPENDAAMAELASALGFEREPADTEADLTTLRGGPREGIVLYWPQKSVRQESLRTYRVDVGEKYEGDGLLTFKRGRTVLYQEPFQPKHSVVVASLPEEVLEASKPGRTITWGIVFEGRRRRPILTKYAAMKDRKLEQRLDKLETSKHFLRQPTIVQELLRADVLRNNRYYTDALVHYLGIARKWPDCQQSYRGIVSAARRISLDDTPLYELAKSLMGGGVVGRRPIAGGGRLARPDAPGGTYAALGADGSGPSRLAGPELAALRGEAGGDETAEAGETGEASEGEAGEVAEAGEPGEVSADDARTKETLRRLEEIAQSFAHEAEQEDAEAARLKGLREEARELENDRRESAQALEEANYQREQAEDALAQAAEKLQAAQGTPQEDEARKAHEEAAQALEEAAQKQDAAREQAEHFQQRADELADSLGVPPDQVDQAIQEAEERAQHLREEADRAERAAEEMERGGEPMKPAEQLRDASRSMALEAARLGKEAERLTDLSARSREIADRVDEANQRNTEAQERFDRANGQVEIAREQLEQAKAEGNPDEIARFEQALEDAQEEVDALKEPLQAAQQEAERAAEELKAAREKGQYMDPKEAESEAENARHRALEAERAAAEALEAAEKLGKSGEEGESD
jgi:hypothetical protein